MSIQLDEQDARALLVALRESASFNKRSEQGYSFRCWHLAEQLQNAIAENELGRIVPMGPSSVNPGEVA